MTVSPNMGSISYTRVHTRAMYAYSSSSTNQNPALSCFMSIVLTIACHVPFSRVAEVLFSAQLSGSYVMKGMKFRENRTRIDWSHRILGGKTRKFLKNIANYPKRRQECRALWRSKGTSLKTTTCLGRCHEKPRWFDNFSVTWQSYKLTWP